MKSLTYSAGAVSKGFWFVEFKKYVEKLLEDKDHKELREEQIEENFLLAPSHDYGLKMIGELRRRTSALPESVLKAYPNLSLDNQKILNLIGIMMSDRLFFELLYEEYKEGLSIGKIEFEDSQIRAYFDRKADQSDRVAALSEAGKNRLLGAYKTYMREANLIKDQNNKTLYNRVILDLKLEELMKEANLLPYLNTLTGGED